MLVYLDALLAALAARDTSEIDRLLAHPLVRVLPREALVDAVTERRAAAEGTAPGAPLRLLQLRHRTAQLLDERVAADAAEPAESASGGQRAALAPNRSAQRAVALQQMELPLFA